MAKRYPHWLDNSDAIALRTFGERYLTALERYKRYCAVRDKSITAMKETAPKSVAAAYDDLEYFLWQYQREMLYCAHKIAEMLRIKVPRYIKDGFIVMEDEPADE